MSTTVEQAPQPRIREVPPRSSPSGVTNVLLLCGIAASVLYVVADVVGAIVWDGYSLKSFTISELSAIDAPSRPLVPSLMLVFGVLSICFGFGVLLVGGRKRDVRVTGWLLLAIGVLNLAGPFVPMHLRGVEPSLTDTMHIVVTGVTSLLLMLAIWFARDSFGREFRVYSLVTIATMVLFGVLAAVDGPQIAANEPTPWVGLTERVCVGAYLLWMFVLSGALLCTQGGPADQQRYAAQSQVPPAEEGLRTGNVVGGSRRVAGAAGTANVQRSDGGRPAGPRPGRL
jgi:Protein of unknown function (DUF998)